MRYELKAVRVNDDGTEEDCILTVQPNVIGGVPLFTSQTMKGAVKDILAQSKIATNITYEFKRDHADDLAIFFEVTLCRSAVHKDCLLANTKELERPLGLIAHRFEPDLFAYFNYRSEDEVWPAKGAESR